MSIYKLTGELHKPDEGSKLTRFDPLLVKYRQNLPITRNKFDIFLSVFRDFKANGLNVNYITCDIDTITVDSTLYTADQTWEELT